MSANIFSPRLNGHLTEPVISNHFPLLQESLNPSCDEQSANLMRANASGDKPHTHTHTHTKTTILNVFTIFSHFTFFIILFQADIITNATI